MGATVAFGDFTFPEVEQVLGLTIEDDDLFPVVTPAAVRPATLEAVRDGLPLALANATEKAKSEFLIAPVLLELRRLAAGRVAVFSGVHWVVDRDRGLEGFCDYLLTRGGSEHVLRAPFVAVVEAKNDAIRQGLGQCIAAAVAALTVHRREQLPPGPVFGVVTTGAAWKFLRLDDNRVRLDRGERFIDDLPGLLGTLLAAVDAATAPPVSGLGPARS